MKEFTFWANNGSFYVRLKVAADNAEEASRLIEEAFATKKWQKALKNEAREMRWRKPIPYTADPEPEDVDDEVSDPPPEQDVCTLLVKGDKWVVLRESRPLG